VREGFGEKEEGSGDWKMNINVAILLIESIAKERDGNSWKLKEGWR